MQRREAVSVRTTINIALVYIAYIMVDIQLLYRRIIVITALELHVSLV